MYRESHSATASERCGIPRNRIAHGDCIRHLKSLPDRAVDLVLTDPPYLCRYRARDGRTVANDDNDNWLHPAFAEVARVMKEAGFSILVAKHILMHPPRRRMNGCGNKMMGGSGYADVRIEKTARFQSLAIFKKSLLNRGRSGLGRANM